MKSTQYRYETRNINAFVSQIVRLIGNGYCRYARFRIPEQKDRRAVVEKVLNLYDIKQPRWRREKRNLKKSAGVNLVWYGPLFVLLLTKGRHDLIQRDHSEILLSFDRTALRVFDYCIKHDRRSGKINIRLNDACYSRLKAHFLTIGTWSVYRNPELLEEEFKKLPYQTYLPVIRQLLAIVRSTNVARRKRGFAPVEQTKSIRVFQKVDKVFVGDGNEKLRMEPMTGSLRRQSELF